MILFRFLTSHKILYKGIIKNLGKGLKDQPLHSTYLKLATMDLEKEPNNILKHLQTIMAGLILADFHDILSILDQLYTTYISICLSLVMAFGNLRIKEMNSPYRKVAKYSASAHPHKHAKPPCSTTWPRIDSILKDI